MEWNRSETLAMASTKCAYCKGVGMKPAGRGTETPCQCVFRGIFRACYQRFRECVNKDLSSSRVSMELGVVREAGGTWSRFNEEYTADFLSIAKRTLNEEEHKVFRFHYLLGADWRLCCRKLNIDKGQFFHIVYRVQAKLGRAFRETQPYGLFPIRDYFSSSLRSTSASRGYAARVPMAA